MLESASFVWPSVTAARDLHLRDKGSFRLIKLGFAAEKPDDAAVRIVSRLLFEAASQAMPGIKSASVLFVDVPRGSVQRGEGLGARTRADIDAACKTIATISDAL